MPRLPTSDNAAFVIATFLLAACGLTSAAEAHRGGVQYPSFDCAQAHTATERAICADRNLQAVDARVATKYQAALLRAQRVSDEAAVALIRETQRDFLKARDACGSDRGCIQGAYRAIGQQLQDYMHQLD